MSRGFHSLSAALGGVALLAAALSVVTAAVAATAPAPVSEAATHDTLLLALDGVPMRVVEAARERGAFRDWPAPSALVSTFPSTTHVAFTALFQPFGVAPADGYELRYFSRQQNEMVGGSPIRYRDKANPWKHLIDIKRRSFGEKLMVYVAPKRTARRETRVIAERVLAEPRPLILGHIGSTDALQHIRGDEKTVRFLLRLDEELGELQQRYAELHGRELRVVLYSDHGNGDERVRNAKGLERRLRRAGFRVRKRLERPEDVVAPRFGIVSYGALFLHDPARAGRAAEAVVAHPGVDLAAWLAAPGVIEVRSAGGAARLRWHERGGNLELAYEPLLGDPLRLETSVETLRRREELDPQGFASRRAWLDATAGAEYPDALARLVHALDGDRVRSRATVLFSLRPGYGMGLRAAHLMARFQGGRVRGTHGGLDAGSSLGFWMPSDRALGVAGVYSAESVLTRFASEERAALASTSR